MSNNWIIFPQLLVQSGYNSHPVNCTEIVELQWHAVVKCKKNAYWILAQSMQKMIYKDIKVGQLKYKSGQQESAVDNSG